MSKTRKIAVVVVLVLAVGGILALKRDRTAVQSGPSIANNQAARSLPQLIDLGADQCIPCKMMAPVLEELKEEYKGRLKVTFIDVWKDPAPGRHYGIRAIPTQIFLDPLGNELFRHEGFYSKQDILSTWKLLGYDFRR